MSDEFLKIGGRDPNGLAKGIRTDEKGRLSTNRHGRNSAYERRSGILLAQTLETVFETNEPFTLDHLEFSTDRDSGVQLQISYYIGDVPQSLETLSSNGDEALGLYPKDIIKTFPDFLKVVIYDDEKQTYKFALREPLYFAEGVRVRVRNWNHSDANAGVIVAGRMF